ncbi:MAG: AI-2E family transporter [Paucibacter sp.]|nr:AI-2E family transporter [Roseateles sp.]
MKFTTHQRLGLSWAVVALVVLGLLWLLAPVLTPFIVAAVLAYALAPAVNWLARQRVPRALAVALVEMGFFVALLAVLLMVVPILAKELPLLRNQIPVLAQGFDEQLSPWLAQFGIHVSLDPASIKVFVFKYVDANPEEWMATALSSARIGGSLLLALVGNLVLMPMVLFYLLLDWPELLARAWAFLPPRLRPRVGSFLSECDAMLGQYLRGQLLVMLVLAAYYSLALALTGFDLALPIGVFTGLAICVPYLGYGTGLALALLAAMLQFTSLPGVALVALVFIVGQVLEGFFLTPRLVGERIGLSPLMVIFALLAFGHVFGFVGVLVALPVSAIGVVAARRLRELYLCSTLYRSP